MRRPDAVLSVTLKPAGHGGRSGPIPASRFRCVLRVGPRNHDVMLEMVSPFQLGETRTVHAWFLDPDGAIPSLQRRSWFRLWDGRVIGRGKVHAFNADRGADPAAVPTNANNLTSLQHTLRDAQRLGSKIRSLAA